MQADDTAMLAAGAVVAVEIAKRAGLPERFGVLANLVVAAVLLALWALSQPEPLTPLALALGYLTVAASASGVYGLARGTASTVWRQPREPGS